MFDRWRRRRPATPPSPCRRRVRLAVEPLENRLTPTAIVWSNRGTATDTFTPAERVVVDQAVAYWEQLTIDIGLPAPRLDVTITGGTNSGLHLGGASGLTANVFSDSRGSYSANIYIDADAGGTGWYIDPNPADNSEYARQTSPSDFAGGPPGSDLYSTVLHELCHSLGFNDSQEIDAHLTPEPDGTWLYTGAGGLAALFASDKTHLSAAAHPGDMMNAVGLAGVRTLPSDLDQRILVDAYRGPVQLAGDWDGNKTATPGVFDPGTGVWYMRNANVGGPSTFGGSTADLPAFPYGARGWLPVVGDWDGNGTTTVGVVDPATMTWYLKNSNSAGGPDIAPFQFGALGWIPIAGDWNGDGKDSIGAFDPATATFYLKNTDTSGAPDIGPFPFGAPGWVPVVGDWDGNGTTTIGVFDPGFATFYFKNSNLPGAPDIGPFVYGARNWKPVAGDWDGNGTETIGVVDPATSTRYLRNSNTPGGADAVFVYDPNPAPVTAGMLPVSGDWNGDGKTKTGLFDTLTGTWVLKNANDSDPTNVTTFRYGAPGWLPVTGDWDGNRTTTVGVFDPATATFYLKNRNTGGAPDITPFVFGAPGWKPLAGDWDGDGKYSVGVFDPTFAGFYLKNTNTGGAPDLGPFAFGGAGWMPVVGDWDGNGTTTVAVFDPTFGNWYIKNANIGGAPDIGPFNFGLRDGRPVAGDWDGDRRFTIGVYDRDAGLFYLRNSNFPGPQDIGPFS